MAIRPTPANWLTPEKEQQILTVCHQPDYTNLPPSQIVPRLTDEGVYLASESTFYRVLRRHGEVHHRGLQRRETHHMGSDITQPALGIGHYLARVIGKRPLVLSVYDNVRFQPEDRGL